MLEVCNLTAGYKNLPVLRDISVSFEKGKLTSLIGPNGCGKSTLLKSLIGIVPAESGEIRIDGTPLHSIKRNERAQRVAYLSQSRDTPDMTVFQMVLHGRFPYLSYSRRYGKHDRELALEAMKRVGIERLCDTPVSELSGGMRQSAYIAMTLAQDSSYLLLDEPTTYLDIAHQLELMKLLRTLANEGKGIVTVMHDLTTAFDFSDTVAVMAKGQIAMIGTPSELAVSSVTKEVFGVSLGTSPDGGYFYRHE